MAADQGNAPDELREISLTRIGPSPHNARKDFDEEQLRQLAESIRQEGVIEPILVQPFAGTGEKETFEILAGERRWRASKIAGRETIPCIVRRGLSEERAAVIGLIENLQRSDLKFVEACNGTAALLKLITAQLQDQPDPQGRSALDLAAERIGQSKAWVSRHAGVLTLSREVRNLVDAGKIESVDMAHDMAKLQTLNLKSFERHMGSFTTKPEDLEQGERVEDQFPTRADVRRSIQYAEDEIEGKKRAAEARTKTRATNAGKPKFEPTDPNAARRKKIAVLKPLLDKLTTDLLTSIAKTAGTKPGANNYNSPLQIDYEHMSEYYGTPPASPGKTKFTMKCNVGVDAAAAIAKACGNDKQKVILDLPELSLEAARKVQAALGSQLTVSFKLSGPGADFCKNFNVVEPQLPTPAKQTSAAKKAAPKPKPAIKKAAAKKAAKKKA